jgi:SsrA-binding protein
MAQKPQEFRSVTRNKKAYHSFEVLEEIECGLVLVGTEVKSLRAGHCSIAEAYARVIDGELWLMGTTIPEYRQGNINNHPPARQRKLLLHRRELERFSKKVRERGMTMVPLEIYFQGSRVKCKIGLCRGKKMYDKRQAQREKDDRRSLDRAMKRGR